MFDRDGAVRRWRTGLLSGGGMRVDDVDELQEHLEDVEADLQRTLAPEEAFWLAAHRVGTPDALTREYLKVRPHAGWLLRAQWAVLGVLAYWLVMPLGSAAVYLVAGLVGLVPGLGVVGELIRALGNPLGALLVAGGAIVIVRRTRLEPEGLERHLALAGSPPGPGLGLAAVGVAVVHLGAAWLATRAIVFADGVLTEALHTAWPYGSWLLMALGYALPVVMVVAVVRLQRHREGVGDGIRGGA